MLDNVPIFPDFRLFSIDDINWYGQYYYDNNLNPYVDMHPANLFVWLDMNNDLEISKIDNCLIIKYTNILDGKDENIIPVSKAVNDDIIEKIFLYQRDNNIPAVIKEIPKTLCNNINTNRWVVEDNRDSFEYILDNNQHNELCGHEFYETRSFITKHKADNIKINFYEEFNDEIKNEFLHHIKTKKMTIHDNSQYDNFELTAIERNLQYANVLNKKAMTITINNKIVSLSMIAYLDDKTASINHLKVDYSIKDIFRYTVYQLAKNLLDRGKTEMNFEQDLGIEGMRHFKMLLKPSRFLEKVTISPRQ
jgi:hypothetical protein